jgi:hypothetical protein
LIRGYDVYFECRRIKGWGNSSLESYLSNNRKEYYECLSNYLFQVRKIDIQQMKDFIKVNFSFDMQNFDPFSLMEEDAWQRYQEWISTASTKFLYFEQVRKSFMFIENFCTNKKIDLETYKNYYAQKHIREKRIDYVVAIYLDLVDIKKLKKVEKILLQNFVSQYNITKIRMSNPELKELLETLTPEMIKIIKEYNKNIIKE